jgi:hypothetical protein
MDSKTYNPHTFINSHNAITALNYLFNLDFNAIDEKHLKIGLPNIIDLPKTKRLCFLLKNSDGGYFENSQELVSQTINLTNVLSEEAKQNLFEYLILYQKK